MKATTLALLLAALSGPLSAELTVHEWGTFTQVIASDGTVLDGLEQEEEPLPNFVYGHAGLENGGRSNPQESIAGLPGGGAVNLGAMRFKGLARPVLGVNTKMETPVIYFYADDPMQAQVEVGWKGGAITQWYPQRSGGEVPPVINYPHFFSGAGATEATPQFKKAGGIDFHESYQGAITWDLEVGRKGEYDQAELFKGSENVAWLHPRIPGTSLLTTGTDSHSESESYLFYRGLGRIETGLSLATDADETLQIANNLEQPIPFLMVFENEFGKVRSKALINGLSANESLTLSSAELEEQGLNWRPTVYRQMRAGLVAAGLFPAEAEAMIQTWWRSYFESPSYQGSTRVFWVMPNEQVDELLPLAITPQPDHLARVLVGRAEVLSPTTEKSLMNMVGDKGFFPIPPQFRFAKAYRHRVKQLQKEAAKTAPATAALPASPEQDS